MTALDDAIARHGYADAPARQERAARQNIRHAIAISSGLPPFLGGKLRVLSVMRAAIDRAIEDQVRLMRREDVPWAWIGESLGITAQGAQRRFKTAAPRRRDRTRGDRLSTSVVVSERGSSDA